MRIKNVKIKKMYAIKPNQLKAIICKMKQGKFTRAKQMLKKLK